jgi:long-chain acyl-CoA synthetase
LCGPFSRRHAAETALGSGSRLCIIQLTLMFYSRFLESVDGWPDAIAVEIQRQSGSQVTPLFDGTVSTEPDGHILEKYSYTQLRTMAESVASWIQRQSLEPGARCAIMAGNSPRWIATYLGVVAAGMTAVPLDTAFHSDQVAKLLDDCGATLFFSDERNLRVAEEAIADRRITIAMIEGDRSSSSSFDEMVNAGSTGYQKTNPQPDDVACILYTSGTTSDPKGVMLSHANLRGEMESVFKLIDIDTHDALLGVLPLFHALAQMANLMLPLSCGARVVFLDSLNTSELMTALRDRDITIFCCVPQFFYLIHERVFGEVAKRGKITQQLFRSMLASSRTSRKFGLNLGKVFFKKVHALLGPKMRYLVTGGSRFDAAIGRDFDALGFDLLQAYGLTETTGGAFCTPPNDNVMGSIGRPLPGVEAKLVNVKPAEDGSGRSFGEIAIRGPIVMKGYYGRPDATNTVLKDGWFYSGDLASVDDRGNYFITGRAKEVIVLSSGKNIYPEEIESYYLKSPWIKDICVMGLESHKPGEPLSERLHGVIVPNFDLLRQKKIVNTREVIRYDIENISMSLPATKRILSYDIWPEELPRTTTRKLRRFEIEKKVRDLHVSIDSDEGEKTITRPLDDEQRQWLQLPDVQRAIDLIRKTAKTPPPLIHPQDNLELDLGLDSMERVELLVELEHTLGAEVDDSAAAEVYTVRELVDLVRSKAGKGAGAGFGWENVLATESTEPEVVGIARPRPILEKLWYAFGKSVTLFCRDAFDLKVYGMEKLPEGTFILCPNHQSFLDAPILTAALPWRVFRKVFYVGTSEIFGEGFMRSFAKFLRLIPVDPDANLVPAMRAGAYGLRHGFCLVLYPEGERSIDGTVKIFKKGAAILSHHLNVPIVPVAQEGFFEAWPRGKQFQGFRPLKIMVGDPIYPNASETPEAAYERITTELRDRVQAMWNQLHDGKTVPSAKAANGD